MPVPLLIVEVPPGDAGRPEAAALVEACSESLKPGRCEIRRDGSSNVATAVAVVAWRGSDRSSAMIEVGRRNASGDDWLSEELTFQAEDALVERFRTLGLTMAVLFRELESPPASSDGDSAASKAAAAAAGSSASAPAAKPAAASATAVPKDSERSSSDAWLGAPRFMAVAGAAAISDIEGENLRWGLWTSFHWRPWTPPLSLVASARFAFGSPANVALDWLTLGLGAAWTQDLGTRFAFRGRLEPIVERLAASSEDDSGDSQTESLWTGGARLGVDGIWRGGSWWALAGNLEFAQLASRTVVTIRGQPVTAVPAFSFAAGLSVEVRGPRSW